MSSTTCHLLQCQRWCGRFLAGTGNRLSKCQVGLFLFGVERSGAEISWSRKMIRFATDQNGPNCAIRNAVFSKLIALCHVT